MPAGKRDTVAVQYSRLIHSVLLGLLRDDLKMVKGKDNSWYNQSTKKGILFF